MLLSKTKNLEDLSYSERHSVQPYRGDIFFANMAGLEGQRKKSRPILVISNNIGNCYSQHVVVAVCSTTLKKKTLPTHVNIMIDEPSVVATEHIVTISKDRLMGFVRRATEKEMLEVDIALNLSLGLVPIESDKVRG